MGRRRTVIRSSRGGGATPHRAGTEAPIERDPDTANRRYRRRLRAGAALPSVAGLPRATHHQSFTTTPVRRIDGGTVGLAPYDAGWAKAQLPRRAGCQLPRRSPSERCISTTAPALLTEAPSCHLVTLGAGDRVQVLALATARLPKPLVYLVTPKRRFRRKPPTVLTGLVAVTDR